MDVAPEDPPGSTVQVCFPAVWASVLDSLNRQREEGQLCDLSIHVQGQVFRAHRCVLAATSPYFHDQVLLKNVTTVSLPSVMDPVAFESVLSSAYTGQLSIVQEDIVNYVTVASFLQMWHIVDKCTEILKRPRPTSEVAPGGAVSRQQSPSSTDCLHSEREGRRRDRKQDTLPPLATWRRPQQFPRWSRQKSSTGQQSADSVVENLPGYNDSSDYSSCEEPWVSSQGKPNHSIQDEQGHGSKHQGPTLSEDSPKVKYRLQQQQRDTARHCEKSRESGGSDVAQERRLNERPELEERTAVQKRQGDEDAAAKVNEEAPMKENIDDIRVLKDCSVDVPHREAGPGPSARLQWQLQAWSHQSQPRPQDGEPGRIQLSEEDSSAAHFRDGDFSQETFEIEKESGQITQRFLVSPDFGLPGSDGNWPSTSTNPGPPLTPSSSSAFQAPSSPSLPSSSSSLPLAGAPFAGKVHYCHCGKAYALKSMRDRHVKMQHLNLRPFGCPVCNKSFKMKHHLTKHLKTHGGLRPFECSVCGKKVIWKDSFLRHQARCQRLAASGSTPGAAEEGDGHFGYNFEEEGEGFLAGHIKVEQGDFESDDGMNRLLGSVSGIVDDLQSQNVDTDSHVFKEEASEGFG